MRELAAITLLAVLCLFAVPASADTISRTSPSSIFVADFEADIALFGSGFSGATLVNFSGAAGTYSIEPTSVDNFGTVLHTSVPFQVALAPGRYTISVTVTDTAGTRTFGAATFDVAEQVITGPPLLNMPEILVFEAESSRGTVATYEVTATSYVDPTVNVVCSPPSGSLFAVGITNVTCTATDSIGTTTGSFQLFVVDTVAPVVTVPDNISQTDPVVTFTASAVDNIEGPVNVTCTPASGTAFPPGTTIVRCIAFDGFANQGTGNFLVTLPGGTADLILPADITVEATSAAGAVVTYTATASDGSPVSCNPQSGSVFPLGATTVECTAGNAAGLFTVTVLDRTPPTISAQPNIAVEATTCGGSQVVTWPPLTATDIVDGRVEVTCVPASGELFPFGVTAVQCTANDVQGNVATRSFTVTVQDTTPPVVTSISTNMPYIWPVDHKMVPVTVSLTATDLPGCTLTSRIIAVFQNDSPNGLGDGNTSPDWQITGALTVNLRAERSGNNERRYTIRVEVTDQSGNKTTADVIVRVAQAPR